MLPVSYFRSAVVATTICWSATAVNAALDTQTLAFSGTPSFSASLIFDQFDPSLGTLDAVNVSFSMESTNGQLLLDNDAPAPASGTVQYGSDAVLGSTDVSLLNTLFQPVVGTLSATSSGGQTLAADDGDGTTFSTIGLDSGVLSPGNSSDSDSGTISPLVYSGGTVGFIGSGTFDIGVTTSQVIDFGGIGGVQFQGDPITTDGEVTITYEYTPSTPSVPEPTSALVFLGLMATSVGGRHLCHRGR